MGESQLDQQAFAVRQGGLGLRSARAVADACYLRSRAATHQLCLDLRRDHRWEHDDPSSYLEHATASTNALLTESGMSSRICCERPELKQKQLTKLAEEARVRIWEQRVQPDDACRR